MTLHTPQNAGSTPTVFVVRKRVRVEYGRDEIPQPVGQHLAAFATRAEAEEYTRRLDREFVHTHLPSVLDADQSPFDRGWQTATHFPEYTFRDWLLDEGIEPPPPLTEPFDPTLYGRCPQEGSDEERRRVREEWDRNLQVWRAWHESQHWRCWWLEVVVGGRLTRGQLERVWAGLTAYQFHEVREVPVADPVPTPVRTAFAVVHQCWEYTDEGYAGRNEPLRAYRTRAAAEAECARLSAEHPVDENEWNGGPYQFVVVELPLPAEG